MLEELDADLVDREKARLLYERRLGDAETRVDSAIGSENAIRSIGGGSGLIGAIWAAFAGHWVLSLMALAIGGAVASYRSSERQNVQNTIAGCRERIDCLESEIIAINEARRGVRGTTSEDGPR